MENITIIIISCWLSSRTGGAGVLTPDYWILWSTWSSADHRHYLLIIVVIIMLVLIISMIVVIIMIVSMISWSSSRSSAAQPGDARVLVREREDETRRLPGRWSPPKSIFSFPFIGIIIFDIINIITVVSIANIPISLNDLWSPAIEYFLFPIHRHHRCPRCQHHHLWRHKHYHCCFHCQQFHLFKWTKAHLLVEVVPSGWQKKTMSLGRGKSCSKQCLLINCVMRTIQLWLVVISTLWSVSGYLAKSWGCWAP